MLLAKYPLTRLDIPHSQLLGLFPSTCLACVNARLFLIADVVELYVP